MRLWKRLVFPVVFRFSGASRAGRPRPGRTAASLPLFNACEAVSMVFNAVLPCTFHPPRRGRMPHLPTLQPPPSTRQDAASPRSRCNGERDYGQWWGIGWFVRRTAGGLRGLDRQGQLAPQWGLEGKRGRDWGRARPGRRQANAGTGRGRRARVRGERRGMAVTRRVFPTPFK